MYLRLGAERDITRAYLRWHTEQLSGNCEQNELLVWTATAGFGDSVNAFAAAFRIALQTRRLLFVEWPSVKTGLAALYPWWHFDDFLGTHPTRCGLRHPGERGTPRVAHIQGHIWSGHPLAKERPYQYESYHVADEEIIALLQPSESVKALMRAALAGVPEDAPVVAVQIRTGSADRKADEAPIPSYARFLSPGDEHRFVAAARRIFSRLKPAAKPRVLLVTDAPEELLPLFRAVFDSHSLLFIEGPIAHSAPFGHGHQQTRPAIDKVLADWFLLRDRANYAILTAWSLFGSSATSHLVGGVVDVIEDSLCGTEGHKPCWS